MNFEKMEERHTGHCIRAAQSNSEVELRSKEPEEDSRSRRNEKQLSTSYLPHQNYVAKQMSQTLRDLVRSMLQPESIPKYLWGEAFSTAT